MYSANSLSMLWEWINDAKWDSGKYPTYGGTYAASNNQMPAYEPLNKAAADYVDQSNANIYAKILANQQSAYDQFYKLVLSDNICTSPLSMRPEEEFIDGEGEW